MNTHTDEIALTRWLDGEMDAAEHAAFETQLAANPELHAEAMAMKKLSASLQAEFPRIAEAPHADFFNSQIQERIAELEREERRGAERAQPDAPMSLFGWLRLPWLVGAAAAAVVAMFAISQNTATGEATKVLSMYAPNHAIQPVTYHSDAAQATVLMLNGLDAIPADRIVIGYHVDHSDTQQELAMTTLYSAKGEVLMVLDVDGHSQPRVVARE